MPDPIRMEYTQVLEYFIDYEIALPGGVSLRLTVERAGQEGKSSLDLPYLTLYYPETDYCASLHIPQGLADRLLEGAKHSSRGTLPHTDPHPWPLPFSEWED